MKTDTLKKSLLDYAIKGKLTARFRRENNGLNAFDEISTYNEAIKEKRKDLEKKLKKCEKELKLEKDKDKKALFKSQIQSLKKEIAKCKEITPLFNQSHEVQPLKASSGVWGVKGGIRGATSRADEVKPVIRKFKPPCPPLKEKANNTESTHNEAGESEAPFEIPNSWAWVKLGDICEIVRGGSPRPIEKYLTDSINGFNWIKISDSDIGGKYIKSTKQKIIREGLSQTRFVTSGSLLLTNSMSFGRPYILNVDGCIHDGWLVLSGFETLAKIDYLYFMLSSNYISKCFHQSAAGGVVKNLTTDKVKEQFIPLPPLKEQQEIVKKLDLLVTLANDFAITKENLKRIEKRIEKSLLKLALEGSLSKLYRRSSPTLSAFDEINTYNEAIKEKRKDLEKKLKICEKELKLEKDKDKKALFKSQIQMLKKELTKCKEITPLHLSEAPFTIPSTWAWVKLGDIGEWKAGSTPSRAKPDFYVDGEILWLKTGDLNDDVVYHTEEKITKEAFNSYSMSFSDVGDILVAMYGATIGKTGIVGARMTTNQACCACKTNATIHNKYLFYFIQGRRDFIISQSFGTGQPNISKEKILNFLIPLPPLCEQEHIVQTLDTLFTLKKGLRIE
ncbi:MAG: restriction endonuclease subunit S [Helicobacter sp.]|uniref:restriction endonuclease subunit S n=1 Tax=Helicobacter sp. TaxID=218 RepID=UPI002A91D6C8|nr:restriction endonuclease subunit S [Helicobacter sp.]MDY5951455.1 restriction endonuclease subunit S [Helicobacter sp.]